MITTHRPSRQSRRRKRNAMCSPGDHGVSRTTETEPTIRRPHGDSHAEVVSREDALSATTSTHLARIDCRFLEPSEAAFGAPARLEDSA